MGGIAGAQAKGQAEDSVTRAQMPLSFAKDGQVVTVAKVRGKEELHHHLETLGFVVGAKVKVISVVGGDVIAEVKGTQVALNRQVATKIITQ